MTAPHVSMPEQAARASDDQWQEATTEREVLLSLEQKISDLREDFARRVLTSAATIVIAAIVELACVTSSIATTQPYIVVIVTELALFVGTSALYQLVAVHRELRRTKPVHDDLRQVLSEPIEPAEDQTDLIDHS